MNSIKNFNLKYIIIFLLFLLTNSNIVLSQCAMCKAVVENNEENFGSNINYGIIFMIVIVYLILFIAFRKKISKFFKEMKNVYD
jgi:hypothetical protein